MYNMGGEGIMSLDAGAPSIKYEGDIKPRQEVADVNLPLDVQGWFQSLPLEQQIQLLNSDIDEAYKNELRKLMGKNTGSGIMNAMPRDMAAFGGLKKIFKKATNVVKDVVKSDIGKAALLGAGAYYAGGGNLFGLQRAGLSTPGFAFSNLPGYSTLFGSAATDPTMYGSASARTPGIFQRALNAVKGSSLSNLIPKSNIGKAAALTAIGGFTGFLADQGLSEEEIKTISSRPDEVRPYLKLYYEKLNPIKEGETEEEYQARVQQFLTTNLSEYQNKAYGGRMMKALGDTAQMASGIEGLPLRQNPMGTNEIDLRETGGFIPPVGIKEKADDIPAMLSNNEFVFTADAVRGMGGGDVNLGAQRMYDMMKKLENGGRV